MVATIPTAPSVMSQSDRFLLPGVSWEAYVRLRDDLDQSARRFRLTYDDGNLEIEMPSGLHEAIIWVVAELLTLYFNEAGIPYRPAGGTTWKRRMKLKGLESDASYYVQNRDRGEAEISLDLARQPPPDFAIETEVTEPLLPKLPVYAGIGIPELWHIKSDGSVQFLKLEAGEYVAIDRSIAVPFFTPLLLTKWIQRRLQTNHFDTVQEFRAELISLLRK